MEEHFIDPSWVELVENKDIVCEGCIGVDDNLLCYYLPSGCSKALGAKLGGVYKWKPYVDPCPLERTTPSRKVKKYKDEWYQRVSNGDNSSCVKCDFYPDNGLCDPFGEYKCVLNINANNKDYYIWKEI